MKKSILILSVIVVAIAATGFIRAKQDKGSKGGDIPVGLNVGERAPEIALNDPNDKLIKLSSLKGKVVLIDFWASWCMPCRMENPNVVSAYNQFKGKNFTILGVSLDKDKSDWLQAIADDQLHWNQVSDLKFWNSKAVEVFKFDGIPYNILIDPAGKVIAESLRGEELESKLKEVIPPRP